MSPSWLYIHKSIHGALLAALACVSLWLTPTTTLAELGVVGFQVKITEKEMVLEHPGEMGFKMFAAWDAPYQRIASRNMPWLELMNLNDSTGNLTEFSMTIGDTDFMFSDGFFGDFAILSDSTPGIPITSITSTGDELTLTFGNGGIAPGELVRFGIDLDPDVGLEDAFPHPDFRTVLFDMNNMDGNGLADNSVLSAVFEDPNDPTMTATTSTTLEDFEVTGPQALYFNQILRPSKVMEGVDVFCATAVIPEPSTAILTGLAMGCVAVWSRRRS